MKHWAPLWSMLVDSSLWQDEDDATCKVFITMLALKDEDQIVRYNAYGIAKKCNKSEEEVLRVLKILESPDTKRLEPQEFEGRRIQKVPDGWLMLNGKKYQDLVSELIRARQQANWQREQRMIDAAVRGGKPLNPEQLTPALKKRYEKAKEKWREQVKKKVDLDGEIAGRTEGVNEALNPEQSSTP